MPGQTPSPPKPGPSLPKSSSNKRKSLQEASESSSSKRRSIDQSASKSPARPRRSVPAARGRNAGADATHGNERDVFNRQRARGLLDDRQQSTNFFDDNDQPSTSQTPNNRESLQDAPESNSPQELWSEREMREMLAPEARDAGAGAEADVSAGNEFDIRHKKVRVRPLYDNHPSISDSYRPSTSAAAARQSPAAASRSAASSTPATKQQRRSDTRSNSANCSTEKRKSLAAGSKQADANNITSGDRAAERSNEEPTTSDAAAAGRKSPPGNNNANRSTSDRKNLAVTSSKTTTDKKAGTSNGRVNKRSIHTSHTPAAAAAVAAEPQPAATTTAARQAAAAAATRESQQRASNKPSSAGCAVSSRRSIAASSSNSTSLKKPPSLVRSTIACPPARDAMREKWKHQRIGWVAREDVVKMTGQWMCARNSCELRGKGKHNPFISDSSDVFVLNCGHLLCEKCRDLISRTIKKKTYKCEMAKCNAEHTAEDFEKLPLAEHTMVLREYLQQRGILCSECGKTPDQRSVDHFHSRELTFVCTSESCSTMKALNGSHFEFNLHSDRKWVVKQSKATNKLWSTIAKHELTRLCILCKNSDLHCGHKIEPIANVRAMSGTLKTNPDKVVPGAHELRPVGHLSTIPPSIAFDFLDNYLSCRCGYVYCKEESGDARFPVMLDCSHVVCNECEETIVTPWVAPSAKKSSCPHCQKKHERSVAVQRKIVDLQFATDREGYKECNGCLWRYPDEFLSSHKHSHHLKCKYVYCRVCVGGENYEHDHEPDIP